MKIYNPILTGSLTLSGSMSADRTLNITVSNATSASFSSTASYALNAGGTVSFASLTGKPALVSGSDQITYGDVSSIPNGIISSSLQLTYPDLIDIPSNIISSSEQINNLTGLEQSGSYETLVVKVVNDGGNKYQIDGVTAPKLTLHKGMTYRFDMSDNSNSGHPFAFRLRDGSTSYTSGYHAEGTPGSSGAYTQIHVRQDVPTQLIYYCTVHGNGMGNSISVQSAFNTILEDNAVVSGSLNVTGDITAYSTSDERLKTNVTPILDSLNKIGEIQGYEYDWIENEHHNNTGHDIGVIAQEIEKIAPEAVTTRDSGFKAVKYEKIIPILIQAIKELNDKVKKLEDVHR